MKIGINVSWMTPGQAGGMEWYVRNLIDQLGIIDQNNHYVLVTGPNNYRTFRLPSPRWKMVVYWGHENSPMTYRVSPDVPSQPTQRFSSLWRLYRRLKNLPTKTWREKFAELISHEKINLWFCPLIYALPLDVHIPVVVTIPDLQHEHYPDFFDEDELALRTMGYQYSCKAATAVIGISESVANEITELYAVDAARVFAIPLALDQSCQVYKKDMKCLINDVRLKFRLDGDFIFYPANGWRHKNHENLIRAMETVHDKGCRLKLVLTGCDFGVTERLRFLLDKPSLRETVRYLGYVDRQDLFGLYAASKMLVFPSLFEGFGLPLLEAMHFDVPVACSKIDSLLEIGGEAVWYFDPLYPQDIADAIFKVIGDDNLRAQLIAASKERVKYFHYSNTAKSTLLVFDQIRDGILPPSSLPTLRPLIAHNWLREGHSRWYFHANSLCEIEAEVIQPTRLDELANQTIEIFFNKQKMLKSHIEPQQLYQFHFPVDSNADGGFHRLDISASSMVVVKWEILSIQVLRITLLDHNGKRLELIR